jgi:hypothetical protein
MSSALAAGMGTTAVDVRGILHGFALQAAVAAALGRQARTRRMLAFVRFCSSHISLLFNDARSGRISSRYSMHAIIATSLK